MRVILCGIIDLMNDEMKERFVRAMCYSPYPAVPYCGREVRILKELIDAGGDSLFIYGCGGHARSVVNVIHETSGIENIILVDENAQKEEIILGCRTESGHDLKEKEAFIVAVGDNGRRKKIYEELRKEHNGYCISIISKYASIGMDAKIGNGIFIAQNAYIGPQAEIGDNTIINTGSIIEHEVVVGSHTHIAPNATVCGRSKIGNNVFCGAGSTVIDNISICDDVIVGAGAVVTDNITEKGTYVGVPARKVNIMGV